jgi:hypothetical protein
MTSPTYQDDINRQQQRPYALDNGMAQQNALSQALGNGPTDKQELPKQQSGPGLQSAVDSQPNPHEQWTKEQEEAKSAGLGWVPQGHPLHGTAGYYGGSGQPEAGAPAAGTPPAQSPTTGNGKINENFVPSQTGGATPIAPGGQLPTLGTGAHYDGNDGLEQTVQDAYKKVLASGGGLPVEQIKARLKEDATGMRDASQQDLRGAYAAAGRSGGGGQQASEADLRSKTVEQILGGYRDTDIADSLARTEYAHKGVELGNTLLGGQSDRALGRSGNIRDNYLAQLQPWLANTAASSAGNVAKIGADADMYGSRTRLLADLLRTMEGARGTDIGAGVDWGRTFAGLMR